MTETKTVCESSVDLKNLMRLSAREDFIQFYIRDSCKIHTAFYNFTRSVVGLNLALSTLVLTKGSFPLYVFLSMPHKLDPLQFPTRILSDIPDSSFLSRFSLEHFSYICVAVDVIYGDVDSSVGTATRYRLAGPVIESRCRLDFPCWSRPALGPTQPPVKLDIGSSRA
jgi:hypothetical protein